MGGVLWVGCNKVSVFLDELHAVRHKDSRHLGELSLLLGVEQVVVHGVGQLLQDGIEHPVVQREVTVGVAEHQPASQSCVCTGQLALEIKCSVCSKHTVE